MEKDSRLPHPLAPSLSKGACAAFGLLICGCSQETPTTPAIAEGAEHIACAVGGAGELSKACAVERAEENGGLSLVVHHPDGAFRRFQVLTDGRGIAVADGADEAVTRLQDGALDVTVGADRYIFPATVRRTDELAGGAGAR